LVMQRSTMPAAAAFNALCFESFSTNTPPWLLKLLVMKFVADCDQVLGSKTSNCRCCIMQVHKHTIKNAGAQGIWPRKQYNMKKAVQHDLKNILQQA
jgi:hypothetical protein